ncbi:hypothetical protein [Tersicoccus solisilvae]|nr:hypothetical protein [Tersicoccus solisilvae]
MSGSVGERLLTGNYGHWDGVVHALSRVSPSHGTYLVVSTSNEPREGWTSRAFMSGRTPRWENTKEVPAADVPEVFSVSVRSEWRHCDVLVDEALPENRWKVTFRDGAQAWAAGAQHLPGIDGDPYDRVSGWIDGDDLGEFRSLVQRWENGKPVGDPEERWEYGPLG